MKTGPVRMIIAGGGTGGHLFPGISVARELLSRNSENRVLFVNTGNPFEKRTLNRAGFKFQTVKAEGIKSRSLTSQIISILKIPFGLFESISILNRFKPDIVAGMGSYSSFPVVICAWLMRIKTVLCEQNILPGITNKILSNFADKTYLSFDRTATSFKKKKWLVTGNPVDRQIVEYAKKIRPGKTRPKKTGSEKTENFRILVLGGSQGAHSINTALINVLKHIKDSTNFYFVHQTGKADEKKVREAYMVHGVKSLVKPFFDDMPLQYFKADLIICRAGATTVAEAAAIGRGIIFIPFPFAADNHQVLNARHLADKGAAEMILEKDLGGRLLARRINYYASHRQVLDSIGIKAKKFGKPEAAKAIIDDCYKLLKIGPQSERERR